MNANKMKAKLLAVMDRGAMGVQVPHANTAEDARLAVEAVKHHPLGTRGLAAGTRPANYGYGLSMSEYVDFANRETLVCVQLEEEEAIRNADEILQVEHSDLSQSMGYPGNAKAPAVRDAIDATLAKIHAAGKIPGTPGSEESIQPALEKGVLYSYNHLTRLLGAGATNFFKAAGK